MPAGTARRPTLAELSDEERNESFDRIQERMRGAWEIMRRNEEGESGKVTGRHARRSLAPCSSAGLLPEGAIMCVCRITPLDVLNTHPPAMRAARQLSWRHSHGLRRDEPVLPRLIGGPRGQSWLGRCGSGCWAGRVQPGKHVGARHPRHAGVVAGDLGAA
jgi:hypothetical protein